MLIAENFAYSMLAYEKLGICLTDAQTPYDQDYCNEKFAEEISKITHE